MNKRSKKEELFEFLRNSIDPKIVDQCCTFFENDINKILVAQKDKKDKLIEKLKKDKWINTFLILVEWLQVVLVLQLE